MNFDGHNFDEQTKVSLINRTDRAEELLLYIARVSSNQENTNTNLIRYLIDHKHWSPFEHLSMTLEIITTRAIAQQIIRHRSAKFQEFSLRYATQFNIHFVPARRQSNKNRQSSISDLPGHIQNEWLNRQAILHRKILEEYQWALDNGIAKEQARFILPLATETKLYMTADLRTWIHYIELRSAEDTQYEHRLIANKAKMIFIGEFPIIAQGLGWC